MRTVQVIAVIAALFAVASAAPTTNNEVANLDQINKNDFIFDPENMKRGNARRREVKAKLHKRKDAPCCGSEANLGLSLGARLDLGANANAAAAVPAPAPAAEVPKAAAGSKGNSRGDSNVIVVVDNKHDNN